jgi:hypothetical protein
LTGDILIFNLSLSLSEDFNLFELSQLLNKISYLNKRIGNVEGSLNSWESHSLDTNHRVVADAGLCPGTFFTLTEFVPGRRGEKNPLSSVWLSTRKSGIAHLLLLYGKMQSCPQKTCRDLSPLLETSSRPDLHIS